jgi:ribosome-associated protein
MIVLASGRSQRHVGALAEHVVEKLSNADWVLIDAGDVIVHLFRPEVRAFYNIEKIWASPSAKPSAA